MLRKTSFRCWVVPTVVGAGKRFFSNDIRMKLELLDERRFGSDVVSLRYRTHDGM